MHRSAGAVARWHHRKSASACRWSAKKAGEQALGRSRGGLSTKIHMAADALGNPVRWLLTGGQVNEMTQASALICGLQFDALIAAKGFDSNAFRALVQALGAEVVIPLIRAAHRELPEYDHHAYRERHLIECLFRAR
jgi:transposase